MTNQSKLQRVFVCEPHCCCHCGQKVDQFALHGLSCVISKGRHYRHAAINSIRSSNGLFRSDGKCPDGLTIALWRMGCSLVWDATCTDTYAVLYITYATREARAVAGLAEKEKKERYRGLSQTHLFVSVAIETSGAMGSEALDFFKELGKRIPFLTHEVKSVSYIIQQVSMAVQRGNAAAILGSM